MSMSIQVDKLAASFRLGEIGSHDIAQMEKDGKITKSERRKITKLAKKKEKSQRQILREEIKMKKMLPKPTKDERRQRFVIGALEDERKKNDANFTICLGCRKRGHFLKDCPNVVTNTLEAPEVCFNCGAKDHPLRACPHPRDGKKLPYAKCFICKRIGHISKECPENANGLYPKGGCCHICLQKTHLVRDCPERTEEDKEKYRILREANKDKELGPRVKGLVAEENDVVGGDYMVNYDVVEDDDEADDAANNDEDSDGNKKKKRKSKGSSSVDEKKKKSKKH